MILLAINYHGSFIIISKYTSFFSILSSSMRSAKGLSIFYNDDAMHKRYKRPCDENETKVPQTADKI